VSSRIQFLLFGIAAVLIVAAFWLARKPSWPGVPYTEVRAYAYNSKGLGEEPIIKDGKLNDTVINKDGMLMNKQQVERLIKDVTRESEPFGMANCFNPRHAFVFYSEDHKPVAQIEVCFECLAYYPKPDTGIVYCDMQGIAKLCNELHLPNSPGPGFNTYFYDSTHPPASHPSVSHKRDKGEIDDPFSAPPPK
jgi:hypothetical protein